MKIVGVDNFCRDEVSDFLVAENVPEHLAAEICQFMNDKYSGDRAPRHYKVFPDDYELYVWEP